MNFLKFLFFMMILYLPIKANWILKNPWPNSMALSDAIVLNNNKIITVGEEGILVKTENGGNYWKKEFIDPLCKLNSIDFFDSLNGLICGDTNILFATNDGGNSWLNNKIESFNNSISIENLNLLDSTNGWLTTNKSILYSTNNSGDTWDSLYTFSSDVTLLKFTNKNTGIAIINNIDTAGYSDVYMSFDSGITWQKKLSGFKPEFNSISSLDSNNYALFGIHYYGYNIQYPHPFVLTTSNCWETHDTINFDTLDYARTSYAIFNGQMLSKDSVSLINDDFLHIYGTITDSGWQAKVTNNNLPALKGKQIKDGLGVIINESGNLAYTRNGGVNWTNLKSGSSNVSALTKITFLNDKLGWASGDQSKPFTSQPPEGIIFKTLDGGERWHKVSQTFSRSVVDIEFADANNGWLVYGDGNNLCWLEKSVDGGLSWSTVPAIKDSVKYRSLDFINKDIGFIAGKKNIIKTADGGETWAKQTIHMDTNNIIIKKVKMISLRNGWMIGEKGLLLVTTDGGTNWNQVDINTTKNLTSIFFIDSNNGWIAAQNQIFKTSDGGDNWIEIPNTEQITITKLVFVNQFQGVAINGNSTYITNDGGYSWIKEENKLKNYLFDICYSDNNLVWSSGRNNTIYSRKIESEVSINNIANNPVSNYKPVIKLNKPSNNITIQFKLIKQENVSISFYSLSGKQLPFNKYSKYLKQGNHLLSFPKSSFSNGVFIAYIKLGEHKHYHRITLY